MTIAATAGWTPRIGIASGIGPLAGSDVLGKIIKYAVDAHGATEDTEYPDIILVNHGIEGVDSRATLSSAFSTGIVDMVTQLERGGATIIGIACNTAHNYIHDISLGEGTYLVNLVNEVAAETSKTAGQYLLLTSNASRKQSLYRRYLEAHGVRFEETAPDTQEIVDRVIALVMSYQLDEAGTLIEQVLTQAAESGAAGVIAGCTELPIALQHAEHPPGLRIIDSNYVLAKALADRYYASSRPR